jgi:mono/diheme cytochrome c family protein
MKRLTTKLVILLLVTVLANTCNLVAQSDLKIETRFLNKCATCHTVGNPDSDLDGPDLTDALAYTNEELNDSFDSMEETIEEKIDSTFRSELITLFRDSEVIKRIQKAIEESENSFGEGLEEGDIALGKMLYNGKKRFENAAVSCASCHDQFAGGKLGGSLGPPLENVYEKMGRLRLFNGIKNSKYKVMKDVYDQKKVTDQEAVHLTTYLESVKSEKSNSGLTSFILLGLLFSAISIGVLAFLYRNRLRDETI